MEQFIPSILSFEGFEPKAKWDFKQWSNGYGTRARYPGEQIGREEAAQRFSEEFGKARGEVQKMGLSLTAGQEAALADLTYNSGTKWMSSGLGDAVRAGDWNKASGLFQKYVNAGGRPLDGLIKRRAMGASWLTGGDVTAPDVQGHSTSAGGRLAQTGGSMANNDTSLMGHLSSLKNRIMNPLTMAGLAILGSPTRDVGDGFRIGLAAQNQEAERANAERRMALEDRAMAEAEQQKAAWRGLLDDPANFEGIPAPAANIAKALPPAKGGELLLDLIEKQQKRSAQPEAPASIREWQAFQAMSPDDQQKYLTMKRSMPYLDTGPQFVQPNAVDPSALPRVIEKNIAEKERQEKVGQAIGEGQIALPKAARALEQYEEQNNVVMQDIDRAISEAEGGSVTGLSGSVLSNVPGTRAYNLSSTLNTIKGNIGFDKLQSMRENSPTGGALGQVAVQELEMLQSVLGSLSQSQSKDQFVSNLKRLKDVRSKFALMKRKAYEEDVRRFGSAAVPNSETGAMPNAGGAPAANHKWFLERID